MSHKSDILQFLEMNQQILKAYGVSRVGLFGSFVRDKQTEASDIDILVDFDPEHLNYDNFINLAFFLEDNLGRRVDLVTLDGLSPHIGPRILEKVEYVQLGQGIQILSGAISLE